MKECKIVQNPHNKLYSVVELHEDAFACPIGQGKTKSSAMLKAYKNHRFCQKALKNAEMEDIIILFDYE